MRLKHITKESGSIYQSTRERVDSRWAPDSNYHLGNITKLTFRASFVRETRMILGCVRALSTTSLIATFHDESFGQIALVVLKKLLSVKKHS